MDESHQESTSAMCAKHMWSTESTLKMACIAIRFNVRLRSSDMTPQMQEHALRSTISLLHHDSSPPTTSQLARSLKKEFDLLYRPAWHCVIGASFGSFVTHSVGGFIYFSIDSFSVLLFKTHLLFITD